MSWQESPSSSWQTAGGNSRGGNWQRGGGAAGGGYRGPRRQPYEGHQGPRPRDAQPPPESSSEKILKQILNVGGADDFDPLHDLPRLVNMIERQFPSTTEAVLEGFRAGIVEQPFKIAIYATLISLLAACPVEIEGGHSEARDEAEKPVASSGPSIGKIILEDLVKTFRSDVDGRRWRETRLMIHLFANLAVSGDVTPVSFLALLQSFLAVVDELGVSPARAERVIIAVGEGIIKGGAVLNEIDPEGVSAMLAAIEVYVMTRQTRKDLVSPFGARVLDGEDAKDIPEEVDILTHLNKALGELRAENFVLPRFLPRPHALFPDRATDPQGPYSLPLVMVPPELVDVGDTPGSSEKKLEGWATCELEIFEPELVPSPSTPPGWILRQLVHDIINIYEINRKDCARILLELPNWLNSGTFKPPPNVTVALPSDPDAPVPTWSLESLLASSVISMIIALPSPPHQTLYYTSLIVELCKFSPGTMAPPVGKTGRKFYASLDAGMDVECTRRFADWLAVHLSNFGFQWLWKDWVPDLTSPHLHPKLSFIRRVVELEIRLSYHERIKGTLPEAMRDFTAGVIAEDSEAFCYEYEKEDHEHHNTAATLQSMFRSKTPPETVIANLSGFPLQPSAGPLTSLTRSIAVQTLLFIGARSFSHFLNATERYLPVLRAISITSVEKAELLQNVGSFWRESGQMRLIITDKLMQYGIIGGEDVVRWVFGVDEAQGARKDGEEWMSGQKWDLLRMAIDKVNGRVVGVRRKIVLLEEEEEERSGGRRARAMDATMEDETGESARPEVKKTNGMISALAALSSLQQTQKAVLVSAVQSFIRSLLPETGAGEEKQGLAGLLSKGGFNGRDSWTEEDWTVWSQWGWWREFCRLYVHHLRTYTSTINTVVFSTLTTALVEGSGEDKAAKLVKGIWEGVLEVAGTA